MGKTGRWIRKLLTGKKVNSGAKDLASEKEIAATNDALTVHSDNGVGGYDHHHHHHRPTTPISTTQPTTPREKRRWSFRRSSASPASRQDQSPAGDDQHQPGSDSKNHAAAADAALAAAKAAAAVIQLTAGGEYGRGSAVEEAAAVRIQSVFRSYLARKALNALKGLVKLQALVRGHLVRKQATATLRCMQALVSVQSRALAQRLKMAEQIKHIDQSPSNSNHRKSTQDHQQRFRNSNQDLVEENIKIVEMDLGDYNKPVSKPRISNYSNQTDHNHRLSTQLRTPTKHENSNNQYFQTISPSPSAITDTSPRTCSNHFDEYNSFNNNNNNTAQSSPKCGYYSKPDHPRNIIPSPYSRSEYAESLYSEYYPGYMANTESSRAKARSHSAPKQRPPVETAAVMERQPSINKRRPSLEGRNVPRAVRMQRSSSQVGATAAAQGYHYPWSVKLDRSAVSLKDSECGSTSTVLTNANYCRSLVGFEVQRGRY